MEPYFRQQCSYTHASTHRGREDDRAKQYCFFVCVSCGASVCFYLVWDAWWKSELICRGEQRDTLLLILRANSLPAGAFFLCRRLISSSSLAEPRKKKDLFKAAQLQHISDSVVAAFKKKEKSFCLLFSICGFLCSLLGQLKGGLPPHWKTTCQWNRFNYGFTRAE